MNTYKSVRNTSVFNRAICKNLFYFLCYYVDPWECHSGIRQAIARQRTRKKASTTSFKGPWSFFLAFKGLFDTHTPGENQAGNKHGQKIAFNES